MDRDEVKSVISAASVTILLLTGVILMACFSLVSGLLSKGFTASATHDFVLFTAGLVLLRSYSPAMRAIYRRYTGDGK